MKCGGLLDILVPLQPPQLSQWYRCPVYNEVDIDEPMTTEFDLDLRQSSYFQTCPHCAQYDDRNVPGLAIMFPCTEQ